MTDDEQGWVRRSLQGDIEAFEALVRRYQRMIHALTYRMTGSQTDAEDLAQETFIQAYEQLDQFRNESSLGAWLHRIAVNRCLNSKKRAVRRDQVHQAWGAQQASNETHPDCLTQSVQAALLQLPPKQRAAVMLTVYDRLSHAEAALALGCSETTVSWRLFAARKKLKRLLRNIRPVGGVA